MNNNEQIVKDILVAIYSVRVRVKEAMLANNYAEQNKLMADLTALEVCLVQETGKLVNEIEPLEVKS